MPAPTILFYLQFILCAFKTKQILYRIIKESFGTPEVRKSGRTLQRFKENILKKAPLSPTKKESSHDTDGPRYIPDEVSNHNRPLPIAPVVNSDDNDSDDPADYDEVCI